MLSLLENLFYKNPLQGLLSSLNAVISTNESTLIITGHVIYNPAYTYKFQLKTSIESHLKASEYPRNILKDFSFIWNIVLKFQVELKNLKLIESLLSTRNMQ